MLDRAGQVVRIFFAGCVLDVANVVTTVLLFLVVSVLRWMPPPPFSWSSHRPLTSATSSAPAAPSLTSLRSSASTSAALSQTLMSTSSGLTGTGEARVMNLDVCGACGLFWVVMLTNLVVVTSGVLWPFVMVSFYGQVVDAVHSLQRVRPVRTMRHQR